MRASHFFGFLFITIFTSAYPSDPNPSARYGTKKTSNTFLTGEIIWFKPLNNIPSQKQSGMNEHNSSSFKAIFEHGIRFSLGYNTPYDGWDVAIIYTGLRYKHSAPYLLSAPIPYQDSSSSYVYFLDQGDLDIGRMSKISKRIKMKYHGGVRALWLTEKNTLEFFEFQARENFEQITRVKNSLPGLFMALDTVYSFSKGFSLYSSLLLAGLVNSQKIAALNDLSDSITKAQSTGNYSSKIVSELDMSLGLRWDIDFEDHTYHFAFNAGYEHKLILNLNQDTSTLNLFNKNFCLQGIALGARIDF